MYPVRLCLQILPDASLYVCRWFLVGSVIECLVVLGFYLNVTKQAGFHSRKLWNRQAELCFFFGGIPVMTTTAMTAFRMPFYGIEFPLSGCGMSSTFFRDSENLPCANKMSASLLLCHASASKPLNKGLLQPDQSFFGQRFHKNSDIQDAIFLCLGKLYQSNFTAAKSSNGLSRLFC